MNQIEERKKFLENFGKMSFINKKKECLEILRKLYGISDEINKLGNIVYNSNNENNQETLIKVYELLIDALYYAKNKQEEKSIENLEKAGNELKNYKKEEEQEAFLVQQNIEEMLKNLDY